MTPGTRSLVRAIGLAAWLAAMGCTGSPKPPDATPTDVGAARYEAAKAVCEQLERLRFSAPPCPEEEQRATWSRRLAESAYAAGAPRGEALRQHLARMEAMLGETEGLFDSARRNPYELAVARFHVADARVMVAFVPR